MQTGTGGTLSNATRTPSSPQTSRPITSIGSAVPEIQRGEEAERGDGEKTPLCDLPSIAIAALGAAGQVRAVTQPWRSSSPGASKRRAGGRAAPPGAVPPHLKDPSGTEPLTSALTTRWNL